MKKIILLSLLSLLNISSYACSCLGTGNFINSISNFDAVAKIKVLRYEDYFSYEYENDSIPLTLVAEVIKLYKGNLKSTIIKLGGDNGMLCRRYVKEFKIDQYYFIQYDYQGMFGSPEISSCGEVFVEISDGKTISKKWSFFDINHVSSFSVSSFENKIIDALDECVNINLNPQKNIVKSLKSDNCSPEVIQFSYLYVFLIVVGLLFLGATLYKYKKRL